MSTSFVHRDVCPVCESREKELLLSVPFTDNRVWRFLHSYYEGRIPFKTVEGHNYSIAKCKACQLIYQIAILSPSNMYVLYEKWISADNSLNKKKLADISLFHKYAAETHNIYRILKKKPFEVHVLEFGMGWGHWLSMAKAFGYNVTGVELSKSRMDFATENGAWFKNPEKLA